MDRGDPQWVESGRSSPGTVGVTKAALAHHADEDGHAEV